MFEKKVSEDSALQREKKYFRRIEVFLQGERDFFAVKQ